MEKYFIGGKDMCRKKYHLMVLENDEYVDSYTRIAANHNLQCLYKIGVYGKERQHELYIVGKSSDYRKFLKELEQKK